MLACTHTNTHTHTRARRLQRADAGVQEREDRLRATEDVLARLQEDHRGLREAHEALRAEHTATGAQQQLGVRARPRGCVHVRAHRTSSARLQY